MIRVLLLDDHAVVRTGYRQLIDAEPDMQVVASCATSAQACEQAQRLAIDVAVVDLGLKDDSGLQAIQRLRARQPSMRVLVFTMHGQHGYAVQAWRAGALGYLTKDSDPTDMLAAVRSVAQGRRVFSSGVVEALLDGQNDGPDALLRRLTPREFDVFRLAAQGLGAREIAEALHLGDKTVLNYMSLIRQKLGASSDLQLLRLAARHGLIEL